MGDLAHGGEDPAFGTEPLLRALQPRVPSQLCQRGGWKQVKTTYSNKARDKVYKKTQNIHSPLN